MRSTLDIALPPLMGWFKPDRSPGFCIFVYPSLASGKISSSSPAIKGIATRWHLNIGNLYGGFSSVYRL